MTNPFEAEDGLFHVLLNNEGQYSLWPASLDVPAGWVAPLVAQTRQQCIDYIADNWIDMCPQSLIASR